MSPRSSPATDHDVLGAFITLKKWMAALIAVVTLLVGATGTLVSFGWKARGVRDDVVTRADLRDLILYQLSSDATTEELIEELRRQSTSVKGMLPPATGRYDEIIKGRKAARAKLLADWTSGDHRLSVE